jgi:guanylate kinase
MSKLITVLGASGVGKSSLINKAEKELKIPQLINTTTRNPRKGEIDGKDYYFISDEKFEQLDKFEYIPNYSGNQYCLTQKEVDIKYFNSDSKCSIVIMNRAGIEQIIEKLGKNKVFVIYIFAPICNIRHRLTERNGKEKAKERIDHAYERGEFQNHDIANYVIMNRNGKFNRAYSKLVNIINHVKKEKVA